MPNADGTLTPDEQALEDQFTDPADASGKGGAGTQGGEGDPPVVPAGGKTKVKIGEAEYDESELQTLVEFQQWALEHNQEMTNFGAYLRGEADFTPKGQEPVKPKEGEGEGDPYSAIEDEALRERLRAQEQELERVRLTQSSQVTAASLQEAERAINKAYDTVRERYGLDEDQVKELANATAQSGILPGIRSAQPDPYEAAVEALDVTYWRDPKYRDKAVESEIVRLSAHQQRTTLAGAVGGSGGSVSRDVPSDEEVAKMSQSEKLTQMAREIEASMRGTA